MRAERIERIMEARPLRSRAAWPCLFAIAVCTWAGLSVSFAQSASAQSEPPQSQSNPSAENTASAPEQTASREAKAANPRQKQIAEESANLLKLANSLKAEMDKTTKDMLSVTVIRQSDEIAKLARKMRTE